MPTGTGNTILSALDARRVGGPVLFLVHRLDILKQSIDAFKRVGQFFLGILTGEQKENEETCDVLFASKDTLRQPDQLSRFPADHFRYIVIDEVHHGQSPTYQDIITYFQPMFMVGMTATPDRTDRKDIFELFDYKKLYEISLQEAIERGFLVPYTYYGLIDDVDYSKIRFQNNRYRVDDLERHLIIPERNEAILAEYIEKGKGDKAIGFCVSIKHADRMAEFFCENGIVAASIHSEKSDRDDLLAQFRADKIQVAFTVDLFNEGMDFPNVRVLLFLRPTESKTVFIQQLGRGLRLCTGKDRVRILDFIGNYNRANQIRKYLAKGSNVTESKENGRTRRKSSTSTPRVARFISMKQLRKFLTSKMLKISAIPSKTFKKPTSPLPRNLDGSQRKQIWTRRVNSMQVSTFGSMDHGLPSCVMSASTPRRATTIRRARISVTYYPSSIFSVPTPAMGRISMTNIFGSGVN